MSGIYKLVLATAVAALSVGLSSCEYDEANAVPRAVCGPDDRPETGMQGQVPKSERDSGRSQEGYNCNLERVAHYQGSGSATVGAVYGDCMYSGSFGLGRFEGEDPGVQVADFSDLDNPVFAGLLDSTAMRQGTWETMKVHEGRGLLAASSVPLLWGSGYVSVYDVAEDCANPQLLNGIFDTNETLYQGAFEAHEAGWSPDGMTYWTSGLVPGGLVAFDMTDPAHPRKIFEGLTGFTNHGFGFSPDGNHIYVASQVPAGITIFDVSDIQERKLFPIMRKVGKVQWTDGLITQHAFHFTKDGHPYLYALDEFASGGVRLIDIGDPTKPFTVRRYQLEINREYNGEVRAEDTAGNGIFGYESHYCNIDKPNDPNYLVCAYVQSGIRVFDISDIMNPVEIAYYNPPTDPSLQDVLYNSAHATTPIQSSFSDILAGTVSVDLNLEPPNFSTDWCMSQPVIRGNQIWTHCDDAGAMVLEFTNGVGPQ